MNYLASCQIKTFIRNDIDETTLPPSAVLLFTVPKSRRAQGNFPGCAEIVAQQKSKPEEKRVGLIFQKGKPPARKGLP